jgi:hypothetical protein
MARQVQTAHPGLQATRSLLCRKVVWHGLSKDMAAWCQRVWNRSYNTRGHKHFGMVWLTLSLYISMTILRGPLQEQLGNLSMNIKISKDPRVYKMQNDICAAYIGKGGMRIENEPRQ